MQADTFRKAWRDTVSAIRDTAQRHGRTRTLLLVLTLPIRLPLLLLARAMSWLGGVLEDDPLGSLILWRKHHD